MIKVRAVWNYGISGMKWFFFDRWFGGAAIVSVGASASAFWEYMGYSAPTDRLRFEPMRLLTLIEWLTSTGSNANGMGQSWSNFMGSMVIRAVATAQEKKTNPYLLNMDGQLQIIFSRKSKMFGAFEPLPIIPKILITCGYGQHFAWKWEIFYFEQRVAWMVILESRLSKQRNWLLTVSELGNVWVLQRYWS